MILSESLPSSPSRVVPLCILGGVTYKDTPTFFSGVWEDGRNLCSPTVHELYVDQTCLCMTHFMCDLKFLVNFESNP